MDEMESLSHTKWEYKYHVVFIPKCRRKTLYEELRRPLREGFRRLRSRKRVPSNKGTCDPAEVCGVASDWVDQGQERDSLGAGVRGEKAEFCGSTFLGARVLRVYSGTR
jgi:hypothetical protein